MLLTSAAWGLRPQEEETLGGEGKTNAREGAKASKKKPLQAPTDESEEVRRDGEGGSQAKKQTQTFKPAADQHFINQDL